jgi:putative membrane protein
VINRPGNTGPAPRGSAAPAPLAPAPLAPGWADEPETATRDRADTLRASFDATLDAATGPALLEPEAAGGLIRHGEPAALGVPDAAGQAAGWLSSFGSFGAAAALLVLGSFGLGLGLMIDDLFNASPVLGWLGSGLGIGVGATMLWGLGREWRALRRLDALEDLARTVRDAPDKTAPPRALIRWAEGVAERLPEASAAVAELGRAATMEEARGLLHTGLMPILDARVKALGWQSARQVFLTAAVLPSPALDAAAMALIGLRLMRQVAVLHGVRPGAAVLWRLLRRLAFSAGLTAGVDLAVEAGVEQLVEGHAARLAGGAAGAAVAARRMTRLAALCAEACRPVPRR